MFRLLIGVIFSLFIPHFTLAADQNFALPVIPLRNPALWREGSDYRHLYSIRDIATKSGLPITWLVHYDALKDPQIITVLKNLPDNNEIGIFLEVTQRLATDSDVFFDWLNGPWSSPHKLYLQGYQLAERNRLLEKFFETYKEIFGKYPKSYGAWYVDGYSSNYIKDHFGAKIQLGLADQYSTDGYQVWGQHIDQPYYQDDKSVIEPAEKSGDPILKVLWAPREPTLSYGESVDYSNFSLQANDYSRGKGLPHSYFEKTLKTLTQDVISSISGVVIGIEVGEVKSDFLDEFASQLETLKSLQNENKIKVSSLSSFDNTYRELLDITPNTFIQSNQKDISSYWYQTPHYRIGLFIKDNKLVLSDLRFYHQSDLYDNDQLFKDPNPNLSRVVPSQIDQVSLHNSIILETDTLTPQIISTESGNFTIKFNNIQLTFKPNQILLSGPSPATSSLLEYPFTTKTLDSLIFAPPHKSSPQIPRCSNIYGFYSDGHPCLKSFITKLFSFIPDIVYTNLSGTHILGIRTSLTSIYAVTFPRFTLENKNFDAQIMGSFISLKQKIIPNLGWYGRQEDEVPEYLRSKTTKKDFKKYGQEQILQLIHRPKQFENGYYFVPTP